MAVVDIPLLRESWKFSLRMKVRVTGEGRQ